MECLWNNLTTNLNSPLVLSWATFLVAVVALVVSYVALSQKRGSKVRCWVGIASFVEAEGYYIKEVIVENLKDKSIAIFDMYLQVGENVFIDLLNKNRVPTKPSESPDIIPPFELKIYSFYPPAFYECGLDVVENMEELLSQKKHKIVLSTNNGKVVARPKLTGWTPYGNYFSNYGTYIIQPCRLTYKGTSYKDRCFGAGVLYLAIITSNTGEEAQYPIYKKADIKVQFFSEVQFTEKCLANTEAIASFLQEQKEAGKISYDKLEIIDWQDIIMKRKYEFAKQEKVVVLNWIQYHIVAKIETLYIKFKEFIQRHKNS